MEQFSYIERNLSRIRQELISAAERASRPSASLVPVTKGATDEEVLYLLSLGVSAIAENRTTLFCHRQALAAEHGFFPEMHLIGSLQKNKVKYIADKVAVIHSLDSPSLAKEIDRQAAKYGRRIPVLLEVNSGREAAKGGVMPEDAYCFAKELSLYPHLALSGVMTMGPAFSDPEDYRPLFRETRALFDRLGGEGLFTTDTPILSMGMSDSYIVAAEEGATLVRVGTSLFKNDETTEESK